MHPEVAAKQDQFHRTDVLYEIKFDSYRCLARKDASDVSLWSRRGNMLTAQFTTSPKGVNISRGKHLVDGEIIAMDPMKLLQYPATQPVAGFRHWLLRF